MNSIGGEFETILYDACHPRTLERPDCLARVSGEEPMAAVASATDAMAAAKISDEPAAPASKSSHLAKQDLATMDPAKLNALSPEVISRQATINIGELLQRSLQKRQMPA
jgi:hypothetical protein